VDKQTFDEAVAKIWAVYEAAKTLNDAGVLGRAAQESANNKVAGDFQSLASKLVVSLTVNTDNVAA
jgi:hypothetical protein